MNALTRWVPFKETEGVLKVRLPKEEEAKPNQLKTGITMPKTYIVPEARTSSRW